MVLYPSSIKMEKLRTVVKVNNAIIPHKQYKYTGTNLIVTDENGEEIADYTVINSNEAEYFEPETDLPLKWCVSKDHVIVANPDKIPTLNDGQQPSPARQSRYYSFINLKILDTANYKYLFRRYYEDAGSETYRQITSIEIDNIDKLGKKQWREDFNFQLQTRSPIRLTLDTPDVPGGEAATVYVSFTPQVYQKPDDDEFENRVRYSYNVELINPGKGYKRGDTFTETIRWQGDDPVDGDGTPDLEITFKVKKVQKVLGTVSTLIDPQIDADDTAEQVLIKLGKKFENAGIDKTVVVGSGLYLENSDPFSVDTTEIAVADVMNSQKEEDKGDVVPIVRVNTVAELPLECYAGFIVQVQNSFNNENDYYLKYRSESETPNDNFRKDTVLLTKSDGYWEEIAKPFEKFRPNNASLPHMITVASQEDSERPVFVISRIDYEGRTAGTAKDNPSFFTEGTPITGLTYYKNRLFFLTKSGTVVTSRAGEINNFFLNTAVTTSAIDPIDIVANNNQRVPLYSGAVVNNGLVLFGESEQYSLTTNSDLLTSETANLTKISNYSSDPASNPIYLGTNLGFVSEGLTRFYEMTNVYDRGPVDINERSQQIQTQFGQGFNIPVSSREQSMAIFYKRYTANNLSGRSSSMYLYRFRQEEQSTIKPNFLGQVAAG